MWGVSELGRKILHLLDKRKHQLDPRVHHKVILLHPYTKKNSLFSTVRAQHVAWTPATLPNSIVLLGGVGAAKFTAEIVPGFKK